VNALEGNACVGAEFFGGPLSLDFVVDVSGKMNDVVTDNSSSLPSQLSKWEIVRSSLQSFFDGLPPASQVGLFLYPNQPARPPSQQPMDIEYCVNAAASVPRTPLGQPNSPERTTLANTLAAAVPQGPRPIADAFSLAQSSEVARSDVTGVPNYVLIVDGPPTLLDQCVGAGEDSAPVDYTSVITQISRVHSVYGSETYVIALPGSEQPTADGVNGLQWLSQAASAGGTLTWISSPAAFGNYFDLSVNIALTSAISSSLLAIAAPYLNCTFTVAGGPPGMVANPTTFSVVYSASGKNDDAVLLGKDCAQGDGWYSTTDGVVALCAQTCAALHQNAAAKITIFGDCRPLLDL
jgi:hypothetical protein